MNFRLNYYNDLFVLFVCPELIEEPVFNNSHISVQS